MHMLDLFKAFSTFDGVNMAKAILAFSGGLAICSLSLLTAEDMAPRACWQSSRVEGIAANAIEL